MTAQARHRDRRLSDALWVAAAALFVCVALVRSGLTQQVADAHLGAERLAAAQVQALEGELESVQRAVYALWTDVRMARRGDDFADRAAPIAQLAPSVRNFVLVAGGALEAAYPAAEDVTVPDALAAFDWRDPGTIVATGERSPSGGPALLGPVRLRRGDNVVVVRTPAPIDALDATAGGGWIAAVVPLDRLLRNSGIDGLAADGYDYQLLHVDPRRRQTRVIAQGPDAPNDPVERMVLRTGSQWRLAIAPHDGWIAWSALIVKGVLAGIAALSAGLFAYNLSGRSARVRAAEDKRRQRLADAKRRLVEEIQQREELERQFSHAGFHDAMTGLPNRSFFVNRLERSLRRARGESSYRVAVIVVHFDRLKSINDSLGHAARDQLLMQAAQRFESRLRPEDLVVAWLGGDEIALLLFDIRGRESAIAAVERLRETLTEPFQFEGHDLFTSGKMGIVLSLSGYEHAEDLLRDANVALSKAMTEDSAGFAVFEPATRDQATRSLQIETDLHRALEQHELILHFQPIVALATGRIAGLEALLRWQHPLEGLIAPDKFIRVAEDTGLIVPITRWVLREACEASSAWRKRLPAEAAFYLSVNLAAQDLRQPDLGDYVADLLVETGMPAGRLRVEVTEGSLISNFRGANDLVDQLRSLGVPLLLDDFGTGYSSLSYLQRFQFDYLKIDRAFVSRITAAGHGDAIVRAIIHMASDLGMQTVAEGIETRATLEHLRALACGYGQGYYFSRPLENQAAFALLESGSPLIEKLSSAERREAVR